LSDIDEYVFYILGLGYIDDLRIWVDYIFCPDYPIHASRSLLILNTVIYLKNLT